MSTDVAVSSMTEQMEFARMVTAQPERGSQSLLPEAYRGNPANVLIAVGLGQSMGLSYAESLYRIAVIKGKPTAAAELIASNVRKAGHRLRITDGDATTTASIWRADDPSYEFRVTRDLKWAKEMGLASNDNYKKQLLTMLQWRAISAVARLACPEALYGVVYVPEEVGDIADEAPATSAAPRRGGMAGLRDSVAIPAAAPEPDLEPPTLRADEAIPPDDTAETGEAISKPQLTKLHVMLGEAGMGDRHAGLSYLSALLDHEVTSSKDLTKAEAHQCIEDLTGLVEVPFTEPPEPTP